MTQNKPDIKTIAEFKINYYEYLNNNINIDNNNIHHLIDSYKNMVLLRVFDTKAIALQRTGKLGTYPSALGQEAISIGMGKALQPEDVFCTFYRDQGTQLLRGVTMEEILLYWGGSEVGNDFKAPSAKDDFPICVPIGSQCLHAAGIATAIKLRHQKRAVLVTLGDGATSQGDVYEAMNVAGIWNLPLVFVIQNNQWAISIPRDQQTRAETLAQKGIAAGIACEQIDGNDIVAVEKHVGMALDKARNQQGPTVIEAITYRLGDHTTADDASRYRNKETVKEAHNNDPIVRLKDYLQKHNHWSEQDEQNWQTQCTDTVEKAVQHYLTTPPEPIDNIFNFHYHNMPHDLITQRENFHS